MSRRRFLAKPQLAWLHVMPAPVPKASESSASNTRTAAGWSSSCTVALTLIWSMRFAVRRGMAISQTTSPSTSSGVAMVTPR